MVIYTPELTAYFDESTGSKVDAYTVAAYVAPTAQWDEFEKDWKLFLIEEDIPLLHKADFEGFYGVYRKFKNPDPDEELRKKARVNVQACNLILKHVSAGFAVSVVKSVWDKADKGRWESAVGKSYYAAGAKGCMHLMNSWASKHGFQSTPIHYVFERGATGSSEIARFLNDEVDSADSMREMFRFGSWGYAV
jgi:hypothetical protein